MNDIDYHALFTAAADGMLVVGPTRRIADANPALCRMLGMARENLIGRDTIDIVAKADVHLHPQLLETIEREDSFFFIRRLRHADGSEVPVEVVVTKLPDTSTISVIRDIRMRPLGDALRTAEARLRAMAESLNVALVVTDDRNHALYANDQYSRITGYSFDEVVGRDLGDFLATAADRDHVVSRMVARRDGSSEKYEIRHRRKDGSTFMAEISASPMHDESGAVIGTISVMEDVTERRRIGLTLAERERRYRSLFEVTPLPIWVFDVETLRFLTVNAAAIEVYGYTEKEFLGMTLLDIRPPEHVPAFLTFMAGDKDRRKPVRVEHVKKDGSAIHADLVTEEFLLDGRRARIVVAKDVTEQLRLEERQSSVEKQLLLAQKMEAVGGLAGGVAHDFNNLLSVMLGASESIGCELPSDSPLLEDVRDIREAAERGAALTRQLLSLGRKEVRAPEHLDLDMVVANVSRLLLRALGPQVRMEVRREVGPLSVEADAGQLEQVIINLAINSRDAMPSGGTLTISTGARSLAAVDAEAAGVAPGEYAIMEVADTGLGMDAHTRARAFEPFFTTKGPHVGTGLGLSTVYGIMHQSGGGVTIESAVGEGTRVTLFLPRVATIVSPSAAALHVSGQFRARGQRVRVLLVEDEPRVRAQAHRLLERSGFAVTEAPDGAEGLFQFKARGGGVDVVVTDVMMPAMGGVEMVSQLRAISPEVPVVFVSGYTADYRDLPLDDRTLFLPKPYSIANLCTAIDTLIERR